MALYAWSNSSGAALALTTSYVASGYTPASMETSNAALMQLELVTTGTAMTGLVLIVDGSVDNTAFGPMSTEEVASGQVTNRSAEHTVVDTTGTGLANGTYTICVPIAGSPYVRVRAKRSGGGADSALVARAHFIGRV